MEETTLDDIRTRALAYHEKGDVWHFHILSPACKFNAQKQYAFVLENAPQNEYFVYYSDQPEVELGKELAPLLHGIDNLTVAPSGVPEHSQSAAAILERAQEYNQKGVAWHHHVLYPDCQFNPNTPQYTLVLEDPNSDKLLESISEEEPTPTLEVLEPLFYTQPKA